MTTDGDIRKINKEVVRKELIEELAKERPLFHSEADFQHSLAWKIHEKKDFLKIKEIRLERNAFEKFREKLLTFIFSKHLQRLKRVFSARRLCWFWRH